jgi:hypothetical protein
MLPGNPIIGMSENITSGMARFCGNSIIGIPGHP